VSIIDANKLLLPRVAGDIAEVLPEVVVARRTLPYQRLWDLEVRLDIIQLVDIAAQAVLSDLMVNRWKFR